MNPTRPTIRCLRADLGIAKLPPARITLDQITHPLINKASAQFAGDSAGSGSPQWMTTSCSRSRSSAGGERCGRTTAAPGWSRPVADEGHETYGGIRIIGQVAITDLAAILDAVPGCDRESWYPDVMPHRDFESGEVVWSNLMDPQAAAALLAEAERD